MYTYVNVSSYHLIIIQYQPISLQNSWRVLNRQSEFDWVAAVAYKHHGISDK